MGKEIFKYREHSVSINIGGNFRVFSTQCGVIYLFIN